MQKKTKKALITGISGQDGSYLAELLLKKNYEVHGIVRRQSIEDPENRLLNILKIKEKINVHVASIENHLSIFKVVSRIGPDEIYHLASNSFVSYDFCDEESLISQNFNATHNLFSAAREINPKCKIYFAGSSEMFGNPKESPQNETTPFHPRSVYGISKLAGFHLATNYRDNSGMHICTGIMFNHESPRRGHQFVTKKIAAAAAQNKLGIKTILELGNLKARRDWGYAPEYVEAMHLMINQNQPNDYVISTGKTHTVLDFVKEAFSYVQLDYKKFLVTRQNLFRPAEQKTLCGDSEKAKKILGWKAQTNFKELVKLLVQAEIDNLIAKQKY